AGSEVLRDGEVALVQERLLGDQLLHPRGYPLLAPLGGQVGLGVADGPDAELAAPLRIGEVLPRLRRVGLGDVVGVVYDDPGRRGGGHRVGVWRELGRHAVGAPVDAFDQAAFVQAVDLVDAGGGHVRGGRVGLGLLDDLGGDALGAGNALEA